jgi:hypothetical protein
MAIHQYGSEPPFQRNETKFGPERDGSWVVPLQKLSRFKQSGQDRD